MQNSLIAVANQPTMSSREIAEITGKRHDNVMMDCRKLRDFYAETYSPEKAGEHINHGMYADSTGRSLPLFILSKDAALDLVTGYSLPHRHAVNQRWKELEDKQKSAAPVVSLPDFTNPAESARAWALQYEEREKAQAALALAAPKVQFFDKVVERSTLMTATQVGQKLGMSAVALNKHLDELDVYSKNIKRARVFKQWFVDKGYGELKQTELGHSQPLFTTSGEAWIIERMVSEGYSVSLDNV